MNSNTNHNHNTNTNTTTKFRNCNVSFATNQEYFLYHSLIFANAYHHNNLIEVLDYDNRLDERVLVVMLYLVLLRKEYPALVLRWLFEEHSYEQLIKTIEQVYNVNIKEVEFWLRNYLLSVKALQTIQIFT